MKEIVQGDERLARAGAVAPVSLPVRARLSITEQMARVDQITSWLASGLTPRQASTRCKQEFTLRRYQADRYVAVAIKRLQVDGGGEPPESKRARIIAMHYDTVRQADEKKRVVVIGKERDGTPISEVVPEPDLRSRTAALEAITKLEGLG